VLVVVCLCGVKEVAFKCDCAIERCERFLIRAVGLSCYFLYVVPDLRYVLFCFVKLFVVHFRIIFWVIGGLGVRGVRGVKGAMVCFICACVAVVVCFFSIQIISIAAVALLERLSDVR